MSEENTTYWSRKGSRTIEPIMLARKINDDWLQSQVSVTHYRLIGPLRQTIMDLLDSSRANGKSGNNLPTTSLRLMLQIRMPDVHVVNPHLGCKAASTGSGLSFAVETLGPESEDGRKTLAAIIQEWAMSSLEPWSMERNCADVAMRVKNVAIADNINCVVSQVNLNDIDDKGARFALVARLLSDQLRGQELFEGLGPCELVLPGAFPDGSFELMTRPVELPAQAWQGAHTFSMVARVQISTMPCSRGMFISVSPTKRVWASTMPGGGNTGKRTTAYAFAPKDSDNPQFRSVVPLSVDRKKIDNETRWEINGDELAVVKTQASLNGFTAPDTLLKAIEEIGQDDKRWWIGLGQHTRLYSRVDQHTPTETDASDLMQRCAELWEGLADQEIRFELRQMNLKKPSTTVMIKAKDIGTAGASLVDADDDDADDVDDDDAPAAAASSSDLTAFQQQCVHVLNNVHGEARPTLWLLGGNPIEVEITRKIAELLFGDRIEFRRDALPENVHGLRKYLPGSELKSKQRFNVRVESWFDVKNTGGLLDDIAAHPGPKYVLICANKEIGNLTEDSVNRRAAIHAICQRTGAAVHHVLPMGSGNTDRSQAKAHQNFIHRMQSAMTDVMLAHTGHIINAASFCKSHLPQDCKAIYGIQALRKKVQMFTAETPVSMLIYTRINLETDTTEIQFHYGSGTTTLDSQWMPLAEGLIWLAKQRAITSDETWLKDNFETQTRKFLAETKLSDPKAVVLIDWATLPGLWRNLTDENLCNAPALGSLNLAQAFPEMSFVRIRHSVNARISVRGRCTTYFDAVRYDGTTKVLTGDTCRDEYTTSIQRLVEITGEDQDEYRVQHFIGMMKPRKTSQYKRGLSCFHSSTCMSIKGKDEDAKEQFFERKLFSPQSKDIGSPGPIDISVLQCNPEITAADLAIVVMGLRMGYPHYDEWTILPAPLFFLRKIDDYIIKYPSNEESPDAAEQSVGSVDPSALDDEDEKPEGASNFDAISQVIQADLPIEPNEVTEPAAPAQSSPKAKTRPMTAKDDPEDQPRLDYDLFGDAASAQDPQKIDEEPLPLMVPVDNVWDVEALLKNAQSIKPICLIPFEGPSGLRKRKLLNAMIRGDINLRVDPPFFVHLDKIFDGYSRPERKTLSRSWNRLRVNGVVSNMAKQPQDLISWLAGKMVHPQGSAVTNSNFLFGKSVVFSKLDAIITKYNENTKDPNERIYPDSDEDVNLEPIIRKACAEHDDTTLSWFVFAAAQTPSDNFYESVILKIDNMPGPQTQAALAYYIQCAFVLEQAMAQVDGSFKQSTSSVTPIHLRRPPQFESPVTLTPGVLNPIKQAVVGAYGDSARDTDTFKLEQIPCIEVCVTPRAEAPATEEKSQEAAVAPASVPVIVHLDDPVMKIKQNITNIIAALEPGAKQFADEIAQIRSLLGELEGIDEERKSERERVSQTLALCLNLQSKATSLLARIAVIDPENVVKVTNYQVIEIKEEQLVAAQEEISQIEAHVAIAEESDKKIQACVNEKVSAEEMRRHARILSALDIELENHLLKIQRRILESMVYTTMEDGGPDDPSGLPAPDVETEVVDVPPLASTDAAVPTVIAAAPAASVAAPVIGDTSEAIAEQAPSVPREPAIEKILAGLHVFEPEEQLQSNVDTAAPAESPKAPEPVIVQTPAPDPMPTPMPSEPAVQPRPVVQAVPTAVHKAQTAPAVTSTPVPTAVIAEAAEPSAIEKLRAIVKDVSDVEDKKFDLALSHLQTLIDKRHYGIANIYIQAIAEAFKDQEDIERDSALLQALTTELDSVDCNAIVQSRMSQEQLKVFDGDLFNGASSQAQAIGLLGAGLSSAIFFDPSSGNSDPLWSVMVQVQSSLQEQPALTALIAHIQSRETSAVILTQSKLVLSSASAEDRIMATLAESRKRARNWVDDPSMHTKWSHTGFARAHTYIYSESSPIGKCLALLAKDDLRGLKAAMQECQGKFRKPKAMIEEAFRKIKDRTELNGGYLIHSINNINVTEEFIKNYLALIEQKSQSGSNDFLRQHELEYIKTLHTTLKEAIEEIDEIIACGKTWTALESIWLHAGRSLIQAIMRLFDDEHADACIPSEIQRLLIQQPMDRDLMPSFKGIGEYPPLLQAADVIDSIDQLLKDELEDQAQPLDEQSMDHLLLAAQEDHIANSRFLPAWRIDAILNKSRNHGAGDATPTLQQLYHRASTDLRRKLHELRQRVTHAMALNALGQKDANKMLYTISTIEAVVSHLGKPESVSPLFPDFPHAYFVINETITKVLDTKMQDTTRRLQEDLQRLNSLKGPDIRKDAERIEAMLATKKPADLRAAHDAMRMLERGQKLPTATPHRTQQTQARFEQMTTALGLLKTSKESFLEALVHLLQNPESDHPLVAKLSPEERAEAVTFIEHWCELSTKRGGSAAQMVSEMFEGLGIGVPQFTPETNSHGNRPARLEFPANPFVRLTTECFIPPDLGSRQPNLPLYAIHGKHPDNELSTLIHELASTPVMILARTTLTLQKRQKVIEKGASVLLIDDFLVAFMAINPHERAQKMLEIGLLNFHTIPYSADGAYVAREMFFGRQHEIKTLHDVKNAAILYGGRRLGKSSLLAQIECDEERPQSGKRALYIPMNKDYAGDDHVLFAWRTIYEHMVTRNVIRARPTPASTAQEFADWIESSLIEGVDKVKRCYLLLDEADDLMAAELALPPDRVGFVRTLQNVSESLAPRGLSLRYCIAGLHNLARMTTEVNSALGKAETIALEPFTDEDILRGIELITKPMAALGFFFDEAADLPLRIMSLCNYYPALIQIYCRKLLIYMYNKRSGKPGDSLIRHEDVERMENDDDLLSDLSKKFSMTLELDNRYKAIALVLADNYYREIENGTNDGATLQDIREMCETFVPAHFRGINTSAYESLLDEMRKLSVLEKSGNQYRLRNPSIAMLLGDKDRVESQIQDLGLLAPSVSRNHGEKRIQMQAAAQTQNSNPPPFFPMPISWIRANVTARRQAGAPQVESTLPILCGNMQSGIEEISKPKCNWKINQFDEYYCNPANVTNMSTFLRTKTCGNLVPVNGGNLLLTTAEWRPSEVSAFQAMAARAADARIQLSLLAKPPRAWEIAQFMRSQSRDSLLKKWNIVPIPVYSKDALSFYLGDNREVSDSQQACEDILYATCGFARLIQNNCTDALTIQKAADLRDVAEQTYAKSLSDFYERIGLAGIDFGGPKLLKRIEATLTLLNNNPRAAVSLDEINELTADSYKDVREIDQFDVAFMQWMGLLQEGTDANWTVPPLYLRLLAS